MLLDAGIIMNGQWTIFGLQLGQVLRDHLHYVIVIAFQISVYSV